jgi:hypothetical protein
MGKSKPSPPPAPDPTVTAAAQTASNIQTAQTQAALNRVNQTTPYGNVTYSQPDPNNPNQWQATQTLSPQEQNLQNLSWQAQNTYGNIGNNQLSQVAGSLSQPINTDYSQVRDQYIQSQMGLIQPQLQMQQQSLQSQLQGQGVTQGSDAWNNAMRSYNNQVAQSYAGVLANAQTGVGAAIQQQESLRDQPLNEASALLSGSQINPGQFQNVAQSQVSPTNVLGAYGMQQNALWNTYNSQMQQYGSMLGGIGGLAGTVAGAYFGGPGGAAAGGAAGSSLFSSDRRLKTDEKEVGRLMLPGGDLPIKTFRFKGDPVRRMGFVAQDVEKVHPESVVTHPRTGVKGVNYARVLLAAHHHGMGGGGRSDNGDL